MYNSLNWTMISFCIVRDYHYYRPSWIFMCLSFSWAWNKTTFLNIHCPSVKFNHQVMSNSLWPHGKQHARLPCPSPTPGACSNSCPLSQWCHPSTSSSVIPFSSFLQSFPASGSFPMSQFFSSGGQSIGVSASAPALPMTIQDWFPLGLTSLISLLSKGLLRVSSSTQFKSISSLWSNSYILTWLQEKP